MLDFITIVRRIALVAAAMLPFGAFAAPLATGPVQPVRDNLTHSARVAVEEGWSLETRYHQRARYRFGVVDDYDAAWGVQFNQLLPFKGVHSAGEYVVGSFDPESGDGFGDPGNHMFRLRMETPGSRLNWGGRIYSVGEHFAAGTLGLEHLLNNGLPISGSGGEIWTRWRTPFGVTLRPEVARLRAPDGSSDSERISMGLNHALPGRAVLNYRLARVDTTPGGAVIGGSQQHSAHLGLVLPRFNLNLDLLETEREVGDGRLQQRQRAALFGHLRISDWLQVMPSLSHEQEFDAGEQLLYTQEDMALQVQMQPVATLLPRLNARIAYSDREPAAALARTRRLDAMFGTFLELRHADASTLLQADLTWVEPLAGIAPGNSGMGVQFTIRHVPAR